MSTDRTLHGNGRAVRKWAILFQIEKVVEGSDDDPTCHVIKVEDALVHLAISKTGGILTIQK